MNKIILVAVIEWALFVDMLMRGLSYISFLILPLGIAGMVMMFKEPKYQALNNKGGEKQ